MASALSELRALVETDTLAPEAVLSSESAKAIRKKKASIGPYEFKPDALKGDMFYSETSQEAVEVQKQVKDSLLVVGTAGAKKVYALVTKDRQFITKQMLEAESPWFVLSNEVMHAPIFSAQELTQALPATYMAKEIRHVIEALRQLGMALRDTDMGAVKQAYEHVSRVADVTIPDNKALTVLLGKVEDALSLVDEE